METQERHTADHSSINATDSAISVEIADERHFKDANIEDLSHQRDRSNEIYGAHDDSSVLPDVSGD